MTETRLLSRIVRGLSQSRDAGVETMLRKGMALLRDAAAARVHLLNCDAVGPGARVVGTPMIENRGRIVIGGGFIARSTYSPVELATGPNGLIEIGEAVWLNFGTAIHAEQSVQIGDRTHVGQYSIIADTEAPEAGPTSEAPRPIRIGADVWIAGRVTVLPGASIGDGSVITAGSVVSGDIPAGVVAGGIPARVLRRVSDDASYANGDGASLTDVAAQPEPSAAEAAAQPTIEPLARAEAEPAARAEAAFHGLLLADFTVDALADQIERDAESPPLAVEVGPFGQVVQSLLDGPSADFALVWTRPEAALPAFAKLADFQQVEPSLLLAEVDAFCDVIAAGASRFKFVFVASWVLPAWRRGMGAVDTGEAGLTRALWAANLRVSERLAAVPNAHLLTTQRWLDSAGRGFAPKAWYLGKVAFHDAVFAEAASELKAALRSLTGQARKLLVLDLDDTLWGGIVGDVGWENLRLGGRDGEGEAFVDLQRAAKALTRRGVVLALVSKNEEATALEAIRKHPEMVLREEDFVGWRINWNDKARNIVELATELNLGLQSVVFIDDNPVERARVREALPEVLVPEWPEDKLLYPSALHALRCFDSLAITAEDAQRTQLYSSERKRDALLQQVGSLDDWLKSLGITVRVEPLGPANLVRSAQLLNKTNQLNLSTRRLSESELLDWARGPGRGFWAITVGDRFGDAGLTGLISLEADNCVGRIVDYVLSCRVMGRKVEEAMLHLAVREAQRRGLSAVEGLYQQTAKNKPALTFFQKSGFASADGARFVWDVHNDYPLPDVVTLERAE
jgi:FkbH-like protein